MDAKETIRRAVTNASFSQDQVDAILAACDRQVPGYSRYFKDLQHKALELEDAECVNLSVEGEIHYLISQSRRMISVIDFLQKAARSLDLGRSLRVLDIGATQFTILFKEYFGFEMVALDRTDFLKERFTREGIGFIEHDFAKGGAIVSPEGRFDICILTEIFEHLIVAPRQVFMPIKEIMQENGLLLFSTPNIARLENRINLIQGKGILDPIDWVLRDDFDKESPHGLGHIREYAVAELEALVGKYGFRVIDRCFPDDSISLLRNDGLRDKACNLAKRLFPATRPHCQVLASLQAA